MLVNNDPIPPQIDRIERLEYPKHADFLSCVHHAGELLDAADIPRQDWQVISGGSVTLRQLAKGIGNDRFSTDLDIVMTYASVADAHARLRRIHVALKEFGEFTDTRFVEEPRTHHGFVFSNPILETKGQNGFPLDILSVMRTTFPSNAPIPRLRGVDYDFPNHRRELFDAATTIQVGGKPIQVAHPGYVMFYKASMNRNGYAEHGSVPKQDDMDLRRLAAMGLLGNGTRDIMSILAGDDPELLEQLEEAIARKISYI